MPPRVIDIKKPFNEANIKAIILSQNEFRLARPVVANEYAVGRNTRRADLVISHDDFVGFEIKSDFDTLYRLEMQIAEYAKYFDRLVVVVTDRHASKVLAIPNSHFDVWRVSSNGTLDVLRRHDHEILLKSVDLVRLLTKQDAEKFLGTSNRAELAAISLDQAKMAVRSAFSHRHGTSSKEFWNLTKKGSVTSEMLEVLSLYLPVRRRAMSKARTTQDFWENWNLSAEKFFETRDPSLNESKISANS